MIRVRKQSNEGDYVFGGSSQDFFVEAEAVTQIILTRLKLLKNEWWEDIEDGLPLFQSILDSSGNQDNLKGVDLLVQERILGTPDVQGITDFTSVFESDTRTYHFSCSVTTAYGEVALEVNL